MREFIAVGLSLLVVCAGALLLAREAFHQHTNLSAHFIADVYHTSLKADCPQHKIDKEVYRSLLKTAESSQQHQSILTLASYTSILTAGLGLLLINIFGMSKNT